MALSEKHRSQFYVHFVEHVGEEAANEMLAQFPSRDVDQPASREFVELQMANLRTELAQQSDRLMARMQIWLGAGFGFLSILVTLLAILTR